MTTYSAAMPHTKPGILRSWHVATAAILVAGLAAIYFWPQAKADVRVISPSYGDIESSVSGTGTVVPVKDFPGRANFSGVVEQMFVHVGQKVHAGEMLLRMKDQYATPRVENAQVALDDAEVSAQNVQQNGSQEDRIQLDADMAKAQSERDQAAKSLAAMKQIQANGSVTEAEVDAATERLQAADANLQAIHERLTNRYSEEDRRSWKDRIAADKATLQAEKVSWANANIASPIAGTVYAVSAAQYDFVPAGADLLHVADLSHVQIRADFDEPDVGKLFIGRPATVTWDGEPGRVWRGHLESKPLAVTLTQERSIGHSIIALDDSLGDLPLDTNVGVTVSVEKHSHVLTIPREALRTEGAQHFVYRVIHDKLERTSVETGLVNAISAEITKGLSPQDVVVQHAMSNRELVEKEAVNIVK